MSVVTNNNGKPIITAKINGPVVKVSNNTTNVIQQIDGSLRLVVSSSSPSVTSGALSPSPNVSVSSSAPGSRRVVLSGSRSTSSAKDRAAAVKDANAKIAKEINSKEVSLKGDLRNIMNAFGDGSPSDDSVQTMEFILRQEMMGFMFICDTAAYYSGSKVLGLKECIYALRNDKMFLSRLFKYLVTKDQQQRTMRNNNNHIGQTRATAAAVQSQRNYLAEIRVILQDLDCSAELESMLKMEDMQSDTGKYDKAHLADTSNNRLINHKYVNMWAKARSVSFARKLSQLQEWVSFHLHTEFKLTVSFMDVLSFLIYDFVAQIVDLSFVVKRERTKDSNPLHRICDPRGSNEDTCISGSVFLRKDEECNNISEILVLASELEAKRLKKVNNVVVSKTAYSLYPGEIKEAYNRMQNSQPPSVSFRSRAERIRKFNFQY